MNLLEKLDKELKECVKCGACRAHCPVFAEIGRESVVARGKVALARAVRSGDIGLDRRTYEDMSCCLLCGTCVEKCPNNVPIDEIVVAVRAALAGRRGLTSFHRAAACVLRSRGLMRGGAFLAALCAPFFFRRVPGTSGLRLRLPLPFLDRNRHIPRLARKPFISSHEEVFAGEPGKPRIIFFVGCMTNYVYTGIGEAALALFRNLGCTVIIPKEQQCCGFPAMSGGDMATLGYLARKNLDALEKHQADYIVTACASCGGALHAMYPQVVGKAFPELAERCSTLADKIVDATALLHRLGFVPRLPVQGQPVRITYHDPCHLRRRKVTNEPRQLLRALPGAEYAEMENADVCCGLGGTFNVYHYGTSMAINDRKCSAIRKSGAAIVLTGCPGCIVQLTDGLQRKGEKTRVMHTLEILAGKQLSS